MCGMRSRSSSVFVLSNPDVDMKRLTRKEDCCNREKAPISEICKQLITKQEKGLSLIARIRRRQAEISRIYREPAQAGMTSGF